MTRLGHLAIRAPNHLGDGVIALPSIRALAAAADRCTVQAPPWGGVLYGDVATVIAPGRWDEGDAVVLFPPSLRVAWQARRIRRRVGTATDGRRAWLTDVVGEGTHRSHTYAALAGVLGVEVDGPGTLEVRGRAAAVPDQHLALVPVSPSGAPVMWQGFRLLADRAARPVVFYGGPGEQHAVAAIAGPHRQVVGLGIADLAATLQRAAVLVGNDSGAAHLARAVGVPTVVVFGSTDPARTGPAGARAVVGSRVACAPCYRKRCRFALECLDVGVVEVEHAVEEVARG